jgi:hypothetical protein
MFTPLSLPTKRDAPLQIIERGEFECGEWFRSFGLDDSGHCWSL